MADTRRTAIALALLVACALTGCTGAPAVEPEAKPTASESAPEASSSPDVPETTLFAISARARAIDGTTVDIRLVGHQPVASTQDDASDLLDIFLDECTALEGRSISDPSMAVSAKSLEQYGSSLMRLEYSISPEEHTLLAPVDVIIGTTNFPTVASGSGVQPLVETDTCLNRYQLTKSGSGTFVADYESGTTTPDPGQWRYGNYGFTVPLESGATIEACEVTITPAALEELGGVSGWDPDAGTTAISCGVGYTGE